LDPIGLEEGLKGLFCETEVPTDGKAPDIDPDFDPAFSKKV
jgi:hypothetical protein